MNLIRVSRLSVLIIGACICGCAAAATRPAKDPATRPASTQPVPTAERKPGTTLRIVLVGDSTVTDKAGWGLAFSKLLKDDVECINTSRGGRSSMSFIKEGAWSKALALKGDYYLIQFGHNDQKIEDPNRGTDVKTGYPMYLKQYVDEARAIGAKPVLITPMTRRQFKEDGKIHSGLQEWADQVKKVAGEKNVPVIDLHARSIELFDRIGKTKAEEMSPKKDNGDVDGTHLTAKSAALVAPLVADELKKAVPELEKIFNASN